MACQQTFIALGNAKVSVCLALLRKVFLLIPLIFILPRFVENQTMGVFLAEPVADFARFVLQSLCSAYLLKKILARMEGGKNNEYVS